MEETPATFGDVEVIDLTLSDDESFSLPYRVTIPQSRNRKLNSYPNFQVTKKGMTAPSEPIPQTSDGHKTQASSISSHTLEAESESEEVPDTKLDPLYHLIPKHPRSINRDWVENFREQKMNLGRSPQTTGMKRAAETDLEPRRKAKRPLILPRLSSGKKWRPREVEDEIVPQKPDLKSVWAAWGDLEGNMLGVGSRERALDAGERIRTGQMDAEFQESLSAIIDKALGDDDDEETFSSSKAFPISR